MLFPDYYTEWLPRVELIKRIFNYASDNVVYANDDNYTHIIII